MIAKEGGSDRSRHSRGCSGAYFQPVFSLATRPHALKAVSCLRGPCEAVRNGGALDCPFGDLRVESTPCVLALAEALRILPGVDAILVFSGDELADAENGVPSVLAAALHQSIPPGRLVVDLEIPAQRPLTNLAILEMLERIRAQGVRVSVSNACLTDAALATILEANPDFIRIGASLVSGCGGDFYRGAILESFVELAWKFGATAVACGVESSEDARRLADLGIDLAMGEWLCPPLTVGGLYERTTNGIFAREENGQLARPFEMSLESPTGKDGMR